MLPPTFVLSTERVKMSLSMADRRAQLCWKSLHIGAPPLIGMKWSPLSWSTAEIIRVLLETNEGRRLIRSPPLCSELWEDQCVVSGCGILWGQSL